MCVTEDSLIGLEPSQGYLGLRIALCVFMCVYVRVSVCVCVCAYLRVMKVGISYSAILVMLYLLLFQNVCISFDPNGISVSFHKDV